MVVRIANAQRETSVQVARMGRVARCAITRLRIRTPGTLAITFVSTRRMRILNKQFLHHDHSTDVLSFRYNQEPTRLPPSLRARQAVGEILIAPREARTYAARHKLSYTQELARYVVHGLLHWLGHDDHTQAQQQKMRAMEDMLLAACL